MLTSRDLEISCIRGVDQTQISRILEKKTKDNVPLKADTEFTQVERHQN